MPIEKLKLTDNRDLKTVLSSLEPGRKYELYFNFEPVNNPLQSEIKIDVVGYLWQLRILLNAMINDNPGAFYPVMLNLSYGSK